MSSNRAWVWTGRLAALAAAVIIPACGSTGASNGSQLPGIQWNSQSTTGAPQGTPTPGWEDPNTGVVGPIGIQNIITSTDDATYDGYFPNGSGLSSVIGNNQNPQKVMYISGLFHPLSTDTGSVAITSRESILQGDINAYRQTKLGNVGGGGLGGGVVVGATSGIILSGHFKGTKMARAHCKHYAKFHGGFPEQNVEGDNTGTTAPATPAFTPGTPPLEPLVTPPVAEQGRLGKIDVVAGAGNNILYSGGQWPEPDPVARDLTRNYTLVVLDVWTHFSVGHWRGGPALYYWDIVFLFEPDPVQ